MNIKELAEQAGYLPDMFGIGHWDMPEFKRFAQLVAAAEREACAKLCEDASYWDGFIATQCAQRIRAKGSSNG